MEEKVKANGSADPRLLLKGTSGNYLLCLLALGLIVRLVPAYFIYGSNDVGAWREVVRDWSHGWNPYLQKTTAPKLNWPPLWAFMLLYTSRVEDVYHLPDAFAVKLVPCVVDALIGVALFVWFSLHHGDHRAAFRRALWYTLNPVAIFTCAFHGQFDCMPALFSLLAVMALLEPPSMPATMKSAFWLNLGILARSWPVVLLPLMLNHVRGMQRRIAYVLLALVPTVVSVYILYKQAPDSILHNVIFYQGGASNWGFDSLALLLPSVVGGAMRRLLLIVLYAAWIGLYVVAWRKRLPLTPTTILGILTYYVFSPGIGVQHLEWIVPFAVFADLRRMRLYTLIAGAAIGILYIFSPYNGEYFGFLKRFRSPLFWQTNPSHHHAVMGMLNMLPVWLFCLWWYLSYWRETLRTAPDRLAVVERAEAPAESAPAIDSEIARAADID